MPDLGHSLGWPPAVRLPASRRQLSLLAAATVSVLILLVTWHNRQRVGRVVSSTFYPSEGFHGHSGQPLCRQLPGADDVVVVMKTGANEVEDKLAVHLRTSLTCYPNYAIFSDFEEDLASGEHLFDAFEYTSPSIKENHKDFAIWRKLQDVGRAGLSPDELSGTDSREKSEDIRKKIPGWQLDKWKFLPMVNRTLHEFPDKHWYVFVEADTYLMWSNLLQYVDTLLWTEDHYIGSRAVIEELGFAHGGSGFMLSRPALQKVAKLFNDHQAEWEDFNGRYWVGDHILAAALREAGVLLENGVPTWQGQPAALLDLRPGGGVWCSTAMTFHHQIPTEIEDLWNFEQRLVAEATSTAQTKLLRHRDLFEQYVLPKMQRPRSNWNNMADLPRISAGASLRECQATCEQDSACMQYAFDGQGHCKTTTHVILGEASDKDITSGWMVERLQKNLVDLESC